MDSNIDMVQILMSTYNGEEYLREQLDSVLNQDYKNISLLIRDDGSTDHTWLILEEYAKTYNNIKIYQGENIGVIQSFFDLMENVDENAKYFALSDQDDVWMDGKISRAVEKLNQLEENKPLLYCSSKILVDSELHMLKVSIGKNRITPSFSNALVENVCTGCTCVTNNKLISMIKGRIPQSAIMHDWWLYLIASSLGEVYYDDQAFIFYRQHKNNVVGSRTTYIEEFKARCNNFSKNRGKISLQVAEFQRIYNEFSLDQKLINYIVEYKKKIGYRLHICFCNDIYRQRKGDNIIFKLLFFFGRI